MKSGSTEAQAFWATDAVMAANMLRAGMLISVHASRYPGTGAALAAMIILDTLKFHALHVAFKEASHHTPAVCL